MRSKLDEPLKPEVCESVLQGIAAIGVALSGGQRSLAMAHVLYPLVGRIDSPDPGIRGVAAELLLGETHREVAALCLRSRHLVRSTVPVQQDAEKCTGVQMDRLPCQSCIGTINTVPTHMVGSAKSLALKNRLGHTKG